MKDWGNIISKIRKIAKHPNNQTLYSASKECTLGLFKNTYDYTFLQIVYLRYLNFYNSINLDIALNEISEEVLDNEIFEDSYILYKQSKKDDKSNNLSKTTKQNKNEEIVGGFNWLFKK